VVQGMREWIHNWKKKGWKTAGKKPVSNLERWQALDKLASKHEVTWQWVKGHAGHEGNERADELARQGVPDST
ncbi:MAG: RNase H family protein, partial [Mariprofundus sp.]|nr:RNase H family protein [Mariprofundus sp.]